MKNIGLICFIILILFSNIFATNIDIYNGTYVHSDNNLFIKFTIYNGNINNMQINNTYFDSNIGSEFLGDYGSTGFFQIEAFDKKQYKHSIQLLILHSDDNILLVSGFYIVVDLRDKNNDFKIIYKKTIDMQFKAK